MPERLSWSGYFRKSTTPIFVIGGKSGRLRYANKAWEELTAKSLAECRGTRLATKRVASSTFWRVLAPPPEVMQGQVAQVRRAVPPKTDGPPWWDVSFTPLAETGGLLGIIGRISLVGEPLPKGEPRWPDWLADLQLQYASTCTLDLFDSRTPAGQRLLNQARLASTHTAPIWLEGEPGTGKRTLAQAIHNASVNCDKPFVVLNVPGLKPYLLESLLFSPGGLGQASQLGAVYFRGATQLPQEIQARLLNWLSRREAPRFFFGSTTRAEEALQCESLLPYFYTRFTAHRMRVPPLREQIIELPRLIDQQLRMIGRSATLPESVFNILKLHTWPGNFRELSNVLVNYVSQPPETAQLPRRLRELALGVPPLPTTASKPMDVVLAHIEEQLVKLAMQRFSGKASAVCEELGITRARLNKILARLKTTGEQA